MDYQKYFYGKEITMSLLELNENNFIDREKEIFLRDFKKFRMHGPNIFSVEDDENIYYVLICKSNKFERFLAFSNEVPKKRRGMECTRIVCEYNSWREQDIITHKVEKHKKIASNLYKVKSKHIYYVLVN